MWTSSIERLQAGRTLGVSILHDAEPVRYRDVVDRWQRDEAFRTFFIALLAEAPFSAYFWETPPVTRDTLDQPFAFVLVESASLATLRPDPGAFARHFASAGAEEEIVTFANLGRDAVLVVPCPRAPSSAYPHLAAFAREAPASQQHALWRGVATALAGRLSERPLWLSTAGLGVSWLHVRLDDRPKYYRYGPYRGPV